MNIKLLIFIYLKDYHEQEDNLPLPIEDSYPIQDTVPIKANLPIQEDLSIKDNSTIDEENYTVG